MKTQMKLYEISLELEALSDNLASALAIEDQSAREAALASLGGTLSAMEGTHAEKCLDVACAIKGAEAEAEAIKTEKDTLAARQKAAQSRADWLRAYLAGNMEPGTNLKDARAVISWRKSQGVVLDTDAEKLPAVFQSVKVTANLSKLKDAIKETPSETAGLAHLEERFNIQIK